MQLARMWGCNVLCAARGLVPLALGVPLGKPAMGLSIVLVEDLRGGYKPLFHEFTPRSGRGTHPMLMAGHADDTPGGKLFLSEVHSISAHFGWGSDLLELLLTR